MTRRSHSGNGGPPAGREQQAGPPTDARELAAELVRKGRELMGQIDAAPTVSEGMTLYRSAVAACGQAAKIEGAASNIDERKILRSPAWRRVEDKMRECAQGMCGQCAHALATALAEMGS